MFFRDEYFSGFDILKNFNQNFSISKFSICSSLLLRSSYVSTWHFSIWVSHSGTLSSLYFERNDETLDCSTLKTHPERNLINWKLHFSLKICWRRFGSAFLNLYSLYFNIYTYALLNPKTANKVKTVSRVQTWQELRMLSSVNINCQVTMISWIQILNCQYCNQCF